MQYIKQRNDREEGELMITKTVIQSPSSERVIKHCWFTCVQHILSVFLKWTTSSYSVLLTCYFNVDIGKAVTISHFSQRTDEVVVEGRGLSIKNRGAEIPLPALPLSCWKSSGNFFWLQQHVQSYALFNSARAPSAVKTGVSLSLRRDLCVQFLCFWASAILDAL